MPADLLLYALVAAGLVFWLRSVLGTRHGEERERPNPFLGGENADPISSNAEEQVADFVTPQDRIAELAEEPSKNYSIENKTAEAGLVDIASGDRNFDIDAFLEGSQDAFVMIVESFAEGDRETLKELLADEVYTAFEAAISEREEKEETQETEIHAIRKAEVLEAILEGKRAQITVKFIAEESSVTRDKDGEIIAGSAERTVEMQDIWTFGRDIKSRDPSWLLLETRGDFEDDNDLIPDTH